MRGTRRAARTAVIASALTVAFAASAIGPGLPAADAAPRAVAADAARVADDAAITPGQTTRVVLSSIVSTSLGRGTGIGALRYVIRNTASTPATNVETRFELTPNVEFVAGPSTAGCVAPLTQVVCDVASIPPRSSVTMVIGLRISDLSVALGSRRPGTLLAPTADGIDEGAGELTETGPGGVVERVAIPNNVTRSAVETRTWTTEIRPIFATARLCATGLNGTASLQAGAGGPTVTTSGVGGGASTSAPLSTPLGANLPLTLSVTGTGWATLGLIGPDETCTTAAAGALGVDGRWRYRSPVELVVGSQAAPRFEGAVWGQRDGRAVSAVRVVNSGPDPVQAVVELEQSSIPRGATGCVQAAGSTTASCAVTVDADRTATVLLDRRDPTTLGRWTLRAPSNAEPIDERLPAS